MTLTIHKLSTRCRSPKSAERVSALVDDTARGMLGSELRGQLGPSLDRLPAVIRMKQLHVKVKIPARKLNAAALATAWARAITVALHQTLAHPRGEAAPDSSRRHESEAAYKAAMLHHIATKGLHPCWEFPELKQWQSGSPADAVVSLLRQDGSLIAHIFAEMEQRGWLDALLTGLDELSLERIMQSIASTEFPSAGLTIDRFVELGVAAAAPGGVRTHWAFAGRRQATRLWARLHPRFAVRDTWHALRLLLRFLEMPMIVALRDPALLSDTIPFPSWCEAIVKMKAAPGPASSQVNSSALVSARSAELLQALRALQPLVPSAAPISSTGPMETAQWIVSGCAGMMLMTPIVRRLDLWRLVDEPEFIRFGGPRALSFLLAGVGMTLLGRWRPGDPVDPAVALFAGMLSEPDLTGMKGFFSEASIDCVADVVKAGTWEEALDAAATELTRTFAGVVRGFRHATREAVVRQFLCVRGRIRVERTRLLVVLDSTPWAVALRLSGVDAPVERVEWLNERRVEFVLEGL